MRDLKACSVCGNETVNLWHGTPLCYGCYKYGNRPPEEARP